MAGPQLNGSARQYKFCRPKTYTEIDYLIAGPASRTMPMAGLASHRATQYKFPVETTYTEINYQAAGSLSPAWQRSRLAPHAPGTLYTDSSLPSTAVDPGPSQGSGWPCLSFKEKFPPKHLYSLIDWLWSRLGEEKLSAKNLSILINEFEPPSR